MGTTEPAGPGSTWGAQVMASSRGVWRAASILCLRQLARKGNSVNCKRSRCPLIRVPHPVRTSRVERVVCVFFAELLCPAVTEPGHPGRRLLRSLRPVAWHDPRPLGACPRAIRGFPSSLFGGNPSTTAAMKDDTLIPQKIFLAGSPNAFLLPGRDTKAWAA